MDLRLNPLAFAVAVAAALVLVAMGGVRRLRWRLRHASVANRSAPGVRP